MKHWNIKLFLFALAVSPAIASAQSDYYWNTGGNSDYVASLDYIFSVPTAGTRDFTSNPSFLGFGVESYNKTAEQFGVGVSMSWLYFSEEKDGTFQIDTATVSGKRFTSVDAFPILVMGRYVPTAKQQITPYIGGGLGPMFGMRRGSIGVFGLDSTGWQLAFAGEGGVVFFQQDGGNYGLKLGVRYVGGLGSDAIPAISYLSFSIGMASSF
jgi:hypothetical protein